MPTLSALLLAGGLAVCPAAAPEGPVTAGRSAEDLEALYGEGLAFGAFLADAERRRPTWEANYAEGELPAALVERAAAIPGTWRLLAIAIDACSDSVHTIPYIALLAERLPNLELRIIDPVKGRTLMEAHRTPDGRAATPTLLLIDEGWQEAGCWIERPAPLQRWALERRSELGDRAFLRQKMAWYEEDGGRTTLEEVVGMIERASRGEAACSAG